jgi:hypothetical protein
MFSSIPTMDGSLLLSLLKNNHEDLFEPKSIVTTSLLQVMESPDRVIFHEYVSHVLLQVSQSPSHSRNYIHSKEGVHRMLNLLTHPSDIVVMNTVKTLCNANQETFQSMKHQQVEESISACSHVLHRCDSSMHRAILSIVSTMANWYAANPIWSQCVEFLQEIVKFLHDSDIETKIFAISILWNLSTRSVHKAILWDAIVEVGIQSLIALLLSDENIQIKCYAIAILCNLAYNEPTRQTMIRSTSWRY